MKGTLYHYTGAVTKTLSFCNSGDLISELHLMQSSSLHFSHGSRVWTAVKFWHEQCFRWGMHYWGLHKYKQDSCHQTLFVDLIKRKGIFLWVTEQKRRYLRGQEALPIPFPLMHLRLNDSSLTVPNLLLCHSGPLKKKMTSNFKCLLPASKMPFLWGVFHFWLLDYNCKKMQTNAMSWTWTWMSWTDNPFVPHVPPASP